MVVYRPEKKLAFASVNFPGMLGVLSGINEKGLAVADLTVTEAKDGSAKLDVSGIPYSLAMRRVLEECSTVEEAEKLVRSLKRTVRQNVAICDKKTAGVLEITPKTVILRRSVEGISRLYEPLPHPGVGDGHHLWALFHLGTESNKQAIRCGWGRQADGCRQPGQLDPSDDDLRAVVAQAPPGVWERPGDQTIATHPRFVRALREGPSVAPLDNAVLSKGSRLRVAPCTDLR